MQTRDGQSGQRLAQGRRVLGRQRTQRVAVRRDAAQDLGAVERLTAGIQGEDGGGGRRGGDGGGGGGGGGGRVGGDGDGASVSQPEGGAAP